MYLVVIDFMWLGFMIDVFCYFLYFVGVREVFVEDNEEDYVYLWLLI